MSLSNLLFKVAAFIYPQIVTDLEELKRTKQQLADLQDSISQTDDDVEDDIAKPRTWNFFDLVELEKLARKALIENRVISKGYRGRILAYGPETMTLIQTGRDDDLTEIDVIVAKSEYVGAVTTVIEDNYINTLGLPATVHSSGTIAPHKYHTNPVVGLVEFITF